MGEYVKKTVTSMIAILSVVQVTTFVQAEEIIPPKNSEQKTKVGVSFSGEQGQATDNGIGNLVMGKNPVDFIFEETKTNNGRTQVKLANKKEQNTARYIMINDDRSDNEDNNKVTPWNLSVEYAELTSVKPGGMNESEFIPRTLKSELVLDIKTISEYNSGDIVTNGSELDYAFPDVQSKDLKPYNTENSDAIGVVKTQFSNKQLRLMGGGGSVVILSKDGTAKDPVHSQTELGKNAGGQGYVLEFNNPTLNIQQATVGNENTSFKSELTYILSNT